MCYSNLDLIFFVFGFEWNSNQSVLSVLFFGLDDLCDECVFKMVGFFMSSSGNWIDLEMVCFLFFIFVMVNKCGFLFGLILFLGIFVVY